MIFSNQIFAKNTLSQETAVLAGGCFWGVQDLFKKLDGIIETKVGYVGGSIDNPTYQIVSSGLSGHAEAIKIIFDKEKISYEKILKFFLTIHDPTQLNRQQNDIGTQYRSEIFYIDDNQQQIANKILKQAEESKVFPGKIQTKISQFKKFFPAEKYHQDYLTKNPNGYTCHYVRKEWQF